MSSASSSRMAAASGSLFAMVFDRVREGPARSRQRPGGAPGLTILLVAALAPALAAGAAVSTSPSTLRVAALISHDSEQGRQAIEGFHHTLEAQGRSVSIEEFHLEGDPKEALAPMKKAREGGYDLLLA